MAKRRKLPRVVDRRKTRTARRDARTTEDDVAAIAARIDASRQPPIDPMAAQAPKCPLCGRAHSFGSCH